LERSEARSGSILILPGGGQPLHDHRVGDGLNIPCNALGDKTAHAV
jgi:hypothetical protein